MPSPCVAITAAQLIVPSDVIGGGMPDDSVLSDEAVQADVRSQININLVTTGVACYAMQHCDVPVIRQLEIGNTGDSVLTDLTVEITGDCSGIVDLAT